MQHDESLETENLDRRRVTLGFTKEEMCRAMRCKRRWYYHGSCTGSASGNGSIQREDALGSQLPFLQGNVSHRFGLGIGAFPRSCVASRMLSGVWGS
jgi:hypothetical protein